MNAMEDSVNETYFEPKAESYHWVLKHKQPMG